MMSRVLNSRVEEVSGRRALLISLILHASLIALLIASPLLRVKTQIVRIGGGPGGGRPGENIRAVGLADDFGGGSGLYRPSPIPQPPVLKDNPPPSTKDPSKFPKLPRELELTGVPIPELTKNKGSKKTDSGRFKASKPAPSVPENLIPVPSGPGAGGAGITSGGGGGGQGVSIGSGTGGFGESWYARAVERRISENWLRSLMGPDLSGKYQAIVGFTIQANGSIKDVVVEKSSGNQTVDLSATRAIMAANPLPPIPPEYRGQSVKILAYFEYPPNP
jgi:protein TonB